MSRHDGVSCDSCLKGSFRGKRYKCLICYDYDLCATCYEAGATTSRHTTDHPMQCILTRTDFDLYYGGEAVTAEQPQSFTCPYCSRMGFMETTLQEHVTTEHADSSVEIVCPVCAALPGGDPNLVTDDFSAHLTLEHRAPRDFDEPVGGIRHVRRIPHPSRGMGSTRRRSNMHFQPAATTLSGLSPSARESMDPIAELLSQLSSVRSRAAAAQSVSSQLQQLEMQLQSTSTISFDYACHRQQLERLPRRTADSKHQANNNAAPIPGTTLEFPGLSTGSSGSSVNSQFLLARCGDVELTEQEKQSGEVERADRSAFVQELILSTLAEGLRIDDKDGFSEHSDQSDSDTDTEGGASLNLTPAPSGPTGVNTAKTNNRNMLKTFDGSTNSEREPPPAPQRQ